MLGELAVKDTASARLCPLITSRRALARAIGLASKGGIGAFGGVIAGRDGDWEGKAGSPRGGAVARLDAPSMVIASALLRLGSGWTCEIRRLR